MVRSRVQSSRGGIAKSLWTIGCQSVGSPSAPTQEQKGKKRFSLPDDRLWLRLSG